MVNTGNKVTFYFHKLQKSWEKGDATPWLTVYSYNAVELCFSKTLNKYLEKTKRRREGKYSFNKVKKTFQEIVSSTVSGLLKKVLELANINTKVFKGYSTQSASTSKVNLFQ